MKKKFVNFFCLIILLNFLHIKLVELAAISKLSNNNSMRYLNNDQILALNNDKSYDRNTLSDPSYTKNYLPNLGYTLDKRDASWNKLQGGWGKRFEKSSLNNQNDLPFYFKNEQVRRSADSWNNLNSLWGKRSDDKNLQEKAYQADWNKLNHVWSKRLDSKTKWNHLGDVWGKREDPLFEESKNWNNLNSMWGK